MGQVQQARGAARAAQRIGRAKRLPSAFRKTTVWAVLVAAAAIGPAGHALAQNVWIRGEVRLNVRTGPGTQYRIVGVAKTGDSARILSRGDGWTRIRLGDGKEGWIPEGYLQPEAPPSVRVVQLEDRVRALEAELQETSDEATRLGDENATLASRDSGQREEIESLTVELYELRSGARWRQWVTGASILGVGLLVGAMLHRNATRRPSSRIRI